MDLLVTHFLTNGCRLAKNLPIIIYFYTSSFASMEGSASIFSVVKSVTINNINCHYKSRVYSLRTPTSPPDWKETMTATTRSITLAEFLKLLSPDQSQTKVTDNIVFYLRHQTSLGWLIDADEKAVICFQPSQLPEIKRQPEDSLPLPDFLDLRLSVGQVFSWLKLGKRF